MFQFLKNVVVPFFMLKSSTNAEIFAQNKILHLGFEDNLKDSSSQGNNGTGYNIQHVPGVKGQGVYFNGNAAVSIPHSPELNRGGTNPYTMMFWMKVSEGDNLNPSAIILKAGPCGSQTATAAGYRVSSLPGSNGYLPIKLFHAVYPNTAICLSNNYDTFMDDTWHFMAISFDSAGSLDFYRDGSLILHSNWQALLSYPFENTLPLWVGSDLLGTSGLYNFTGYLDELRIFDRGFNESMIGVFMQEDLQTSGPTNNPTNPPTNNPVSNPTEISTNPPTTNPPTTNPPTTNSPTNNPVSGSTDVSTDSPTNNPVSGSTDVSTDSPTNNPAGGSIDISTSRPDNSTNDNNDAQQKEKKSDQYFVVKVVGGIFGGATFLGGIVLGCFCYKKNKKLQQQEGYEKNSDRSQRVKSDDVDLNVGGNHTPGGIINNKNNEYQEKMVANISYFIDKRPKSGNKLSSYAHMNTNFSNLTEGQEGEIVTGNDMFENNDVDVDVDKIEDILADDLVNDHMKTNKGMFDNNDADVNELESILADDHMKMDNGRKNKGTRGLNDDDAIQLVNMAFDDGVNENKIAKNELIKKKDNEFANELNSNPMNVLEDDIIEQMNDDQLTVGGDNSGNTSEQVFNQSNVVFPPVNHPGNDGGSNDNENSESYRMN